VHEIYLERAACDDIKRLPKGIADQVIAKIRSLSAEPRPAGCRKLKGSRSDWRLRVGDYRILYEIDDVSNRINVMRVKHRREAYR